MLASNHLSQRDGSPIEFSSAERRVNLDTEGNPPPADDHLPPIHRIPVEILGNIFMDIANRSIDDLTPIFTLSQVCKHWRRVARGTSQLWTNIPFESRCPEWIRSALVLSGTVPISVTIEGIEWDSLRSSIRHALRELSRIRDLRFHMEIESCALSEEVLDGLSSNRSPCLEILDLSDVEIEGDDVFKGETPERLRVVTLSQCYIHATSPIFQSQLTSLSLHRCLDTDVLAILAHIPSLESFTLDSDEQCDEEVFPLPKQAVALHRLKSLDLLEQSRRVLELMRYIDHPADTSCSLSPMDDFLPLDVVLPAYAHIFHDQVSAASTAGHTFSTLDVSSSLPDSIDHAPSTLSLTLSVPLAAGKACQTALPSTLQFSSNWGSLFPQVLSAMPILEHVDTLRMTRSRGCPPHMWLDLAEHLPRVKHIEVNDVTARSLAPVLCEIRAPRSPFFLQLATLTMRNAWFESRSERLPPSVARYLGLPPQPELVSWTHADSAAPSLLNSLLEALRHRKASGSVVRLVLRNCSLIPVMIDRFQEALGEDAVDWDGNGAL